MRQIHAWGLVALVATAAGAAGFASSQTGPDSGLKPGEHAEAFDVYDVTGPNKGRELCYR